MGKSSPKPRYFIILPGHKKLLRMGNIIYSEIREYTYLLWTQEPSSWGEARVLSKLNCFGDGFLLLIFFVDENSPVPSPKVHHWDSRKKIDLYIPFTKIQPFLDLLRNEKHVHVHIDLDHPERTYLTTEKNNAGTKPEGASFPR